MKATNKLISGIPVKVFYDDTLVLETDVNWFFSYLDSLFVEKSWTTRPLMLQIGMMLVKVADTGGMIEIFEPDMISLPICFVKGITHTLQTLRQQKDTFESLEIDAEIFFPNLRQHVTQCLKWEDTNSYILERSKSIGNDSGWYIGCQNHEHDHENAKNLRRVSIYDIAINHHEIVQFLALPPGTTVLLENDYPHICFAGAEKLPKAESFLSRSIMKKLG